MNLTKYISDGSIMFLAVAIAAASLSGESKAFADDPKFDYGKKEQAVKEEAKEEPAWKVSAQAGLILTTGNSQASSMSAGASASRRAGNNKLSLDAAGAYARSRIFLAADNDGSGNIGPDEIASLSQTTTKAWLGKARYDRFLTEHNSLYLAGLAGADEPAGKEFIGGAQAGYSRQLYKSDKHELVGEAGYDFSYEDLLVGDGLSIHSARFFAGYKGTLSPDTALQGSVEFLINMNGLTGAQGEIDSFQDRRTLLGLSLTTKLYNNMSFRFGFMARHDNAPAPRPPLSLPYIDGFVPLADKLDTKTEASLIVTFL